MTLDHSSPDERTAAYMCPDEQPLPEDRHPDYDPTEPDEERLNFWDRIVSQGGQL